MLLTPDPIYIFNSFSPIKVFLYPFTRNGQPTSLFPFESTPQTIPVQGYMRYPHSLKWRIFSPCKPFQNPEVIYLMFFHSDSIGLSLLCDAPLALPLSQLSQGLLYLAFRPGVWKISSQSILMLLLPPFQITVWPPVIQGDMNTFHKWTVVFVSVKHIYQESLITQQFLLVYMVF